MTAITKAPASSHSVIEDVTALLTASCFVAFGVFMLRDCGLITGGTAGLALLLTHFSPFSFGQLFMALNLPFFYLAWKKMGLAFTLRTILSIVVVSLLSDNLGQVIQIGYVHPFFAGLVGGLMMGVGLLIFFRHKASLGGFNIFALYLQERFNIRAGKVQMALDCTIVVASFFTLSAWLLLCSVVGAIALNFILATNHKAGRYNAS